MECIVTDIML